MIYLVSMIEQSYARREMEYTRSFLNKICRKEVSKCVAYIQDMPKQIFDNDYFVVADYKAHPAYESISDYEKQLWDKIFDNIPSESLVIWLGDARFLSTWKKPKMAIGSYMTIWEPFITEKYKGFTNMFATSDIRPITWKTLIPELPYNYSLSETQCCWEPFINRDKELDLTYIMHGTIKHRLSQLNWLINLNATMMLGDWENRTEPEVKEFVSKRPDVFYQKAKVFGPDWLSLLSIARYTIIADDDNKDFKAMLSARFWEAIRADCIPLIYEPKDKNRKIYEGFDSLRTTAYFNNADDLQRILTLKPLYNQCRKELKQFELKYVGGAL